MEINLNISGRTFKVQKDVLCRSQLFANMFADCDTIDDEIKIYRSSKLFEHVYAYLLDNKYPYPKKYYAELDYYLVNYATWKLFDPFESIMTELVHNIPNWINNKNEEIKNDIINQITSNTEKVESDIKCSVSYCNIRCMLPICEEHRGECCYYGYIDQNGPIACWNRQKCENKISDTQIYCHDHQNCD
uniref:BTB domain-containing protein n=1 Tax=viral metagenome TaxID=1070528 RepID=A0A6C0C8W0_9ZZZZ